MGLTPFTSLAHLTITKLGAAKLAVATTALIVGGGTGLASVSALPAPAQSAASHVLVRFGVEVPDPSAQADHTGEVEQDHHGSGNIFDSLRLISSGPGASRTEDHAPSNPAGGSVDDHGVDAPAVGDSPVATIPGTEDHLHPEDASVHHSSTAIEDNPHTEDHSSGDDSSADIVESPESESRPREARHSESPEPTAPSNNPPSSNIDDSSGGGSGSGGHGGADDAPQSNP